VADLALITDYPSLKAAIAKWLTRENDVEFLSVLPVLIQQAEQKIKRRVRRKTIRAQSTITQESFSFPADCAELRSIHLLTSSQRQDLPIEIVTSEVRAERRARSAPTGRPRWASVEGTQIVFAPAPDSTYKVELKYYEKLVPLSATNLTNSILTEASDIYLYGALLEATPFLEHDERIPVWKAAFDGAIAELDDQREREEFQASIRPARLPVRFG
jgi:hypothetical protein